MMMYSYLFYPQVVDLNKQNQRPGVVQIRFTSNYEKEFWDINVQVESKRTGVSIGTSRRTFFPA